MSTTADRSTGGNAVAIGSWLDAQGSWLRQALTPWRVSGALKNYKEQPI